MINNNQYFPAEHKKGPHHLVRPTFNEKINS